MRTTARHVYQFQVAVLELERTRRRQEQRAMKERLEQIEQRLREITAEIAARQRALAEGDMHVHAHSMPGLRASHRAGRSVRRL
jgi:predicted alpha/beta-hydrolase family hydrolase